MKRVKLIMASLVAAVVLSGCGLPFVHTQSEQDQAAEVVRKCVDAYWSANYKDPKSFTAYDQYLMPDLAAKLNASLADNNKLLVQHNGYVTHGPVIVNFIKQDGNSYIFDGKTTYKVNSYTEGEDPSTRTFEGIFTVVKQSDGKFLITGIQDPSKFQK